MAKKKVLSSRGGVKKAKVIPLDDAGEDDGPSRLVANNRNNAAIPLVPSICDVIESSKKGDTSLDQFDAVEEGWELVAVRKIPERADLVEPPQGFFERDELWMFCLECLSRRIRQYEIKRLLKRFIASMGFRPDIGISTFTAIMSKARVELRMSVDIHRDDHIAEGFETMRQVIADPDSTHLDRIKAQQVINDMLGLSAKYQGGGETAEDQVKKIRELLEGEAQDFEDDEDEMEL